MKTFCHMFTYVWPQWPRLVAVVISVVVIALLLSVSFMTIIPLLTVMMGSEGLHGWVDRKTCEWQYGLEFSVPTAPELAEVSSSSLRNHLEVIAVEKDGLADAAGIRCNDRVVDVNSVAVGQSDIPYTRLMAGLAATTRETVSIVLARPVNDRFTRETVELATPHNEQFVRQLDWGPFRRLKWRANLVALEAAHWAVGFLPREQTPENKTKAVVAIMLAMVIITVVRCIAKFYQDYLGEKIVQIAINLMREDVFAHLTHMPMSAFAEEKPSDAISRIVRDTTVMGGAVKVLLGRGLREPIVGIALLSTALLLNWQLTLVFLGGAPFVAATLGSLGKKMKKATRRSLEAGSQMLSKLEEAMIGLRVVKVYNRQQHEQLLFKSINDRLLKQLLRISRVEAATHPILEVLAILAAAVAIVVGMQWVTGGSLDGPEFLTLLALLGASAESVRKSSDIWNRVQQGNAAAERVFAVLDQPVEFEKVDAVPLPPVGGNVEFRDVIFTYPKAAQPALREVSLTVTGGCNVAIVGPNGSGKTTLANLLPRFYDPDSGRILIDGRDTRDVTIASLRNQIAMVTQDIVTFNDTIAANIAYGRHNATHEEIEQAARRAYAHEFICQLPKGYETVIGEHGAGLSGGQLQRIVIARAILKNPAILIFDEATSQVDADSEAKIHRAIEQIVQNRTTFIIAHRFSTVVAADVIVVMDKGRIIAQGQHDELMRTCPVYQALYETQLIKA